MFKSQKGGLMKRVKAKGGAPRVEKALKAEVHTEEYTMLGAIRTRHERLKDVLENRFYPFLPLEEVVLHRDLSGMIYPFSWRVPRSIETPVLISYCQGRVSQFRIDLRDSLYFKHFHIEGGR